MICRALWSTITSISSWLRCACTWKWSERPVFLHDRLVSRYCFCLQVPGLWKSDVDSAFRRVPVNPEHSWATGRQPLAAKHAGCDNIYVRDSGVAYLHHGVPLIALHKGMPFGATASVVAWHRVGALLATIARDVLHLPSTITLLPTGTLFGHRALCCVTVVRASAGPRRWSIA